MVVSGDPFRLSDEPEPSHSSSSSQTESLLGHPTARSSPPSTTPFRDETETEDDLEMLALRDEMREKPRASDPRFQFVIPTREDVLNARPRKRDRHPKMVVTGLGVLLLGAWAISQLLAMGTRYGRGGPKINVILMISDGMGPASETLSRSFLSHLATTLSPTSPSSTLLNASVWASLSPYFSPSASSPAKYGSTPLDAMLIGTSRTRSSNSLITDSAAGATAFASGIHTYNGGIGIEPVGKTPVGTVLEAAKRQGFSTGLVATSRLTHATPAAFYSHVVDRDLESLIAPFLIGQGPQGPIVDIALGGGLCYFLPNTTSASCRTDDRDLLEEAKDKGVKVLLGLEELNEWHDEGAHEGKAVGQGMVLGLFHDDHMDYEIDRQQITVVANQQPSLKQMAMHALSHLDRIDDKGFFLMIEGSRIDMAGHNNDPVGHVSDILSYHTTVDYLQKWVTAKNDAGEPTILISVSDHETGGLALGLQLGEQYPEYLWYPEMLVKAKASTSFLGGKVAAEPNPTVDWLRSEIFLAGLGIEDPSTEELDHILLHSDNSHTINLALAQSISRRAQLGWSTHGHSGVDVNLYSWGFNSTGLAGNRENTEIAEHIAHAMGLNLDVVTIELNKDLSWHSPNAGHTPARTTQLAHYHGDF